MLKTGLNPNVTDPLHTHWQTRAYKPETHTRTASDRIHTLWIMYGDTKDNVHWNAANIWILSLQSCCFFWYFKLNLSKENIKQQCRSCEACLFFYLDNRRNFVKSSFRSNRGLRHLNLSFKVCWVICPTLSETSWFIVVQTCRLLSFLLVFKDWTRKKMFIRYIFSFIKHLR